MNIRIYCSLNREQCVRKYYMNTTTIQFRYFLRRFSFIENRNHYIEMDKTIVTFTLCKVAYAPAGAAFNR